MFKRLVFPLFVLLLLVALYFWAAWHWSYSNGERAGWVQKLSNKGWICKTWEGELSMVAMPGAAPEKFVFTVHDNAVADKVTKAMGKRVTLHYEQKVGLPGSCFGETRYYVDGVTVSDEISLSPGVGVQQSQPQPSTPGTPGAPK
jgi:hypothetical protein